MTQTNLLLPLEDSPSLLDNHGPLFILGCPRSGTTFLSDCLAALEQIEEFVGVLAPPRLMHWIACQSMRGADVTNSLLVMRDLFWQSFWRRRFSWSERLVQVIRGNKSARHLIRKPSLDGVLFCYKEPFLSFAVDQVAGHFANSKFIHIVRDGRDGADSLERCYPDALTDRVLTDERLAHNKNSEIGIIRRYRDYHLPWWVPEGQENDFIELSPYGRCVWLWKEMVSRTIQSGQLLGSQRYLELRYEDVAARPAKNAERIFKFLDIPISSKLLRRMSQARTDSIGIGRSRQSPERLDEAATVVGDLLLQLGYE